MSTTSNDPDAIRADIERTRAELSGNVDQLTDQANPKNIARRTVEDVKQSAVGLKDRVMGAAPDAGTVGEGISGVPGAAQRKTQGNPLAAGLVAFGAGLLLGGLIPSSRTEQQGVAQLKQAAEPLKEELTDKAKEVGQNLRGPAQEAVASVQETAQSAVQEVKAEGQGAAEQVQDQAQTAKENVQGSAGS